MFNVATKQLALNSENRLNCLFFSLVQSRSQIDGLKFYENIESSILKKSHAKITANVVNRIHRIQKGNILSGMKVSEFDKKGNGLVFMYNEAKKANIRIPIFDTLPGEVLSLRVEDYDIVNNKLKVKNLGAARRSPFEVDAPCTHFYDGCGGCSHQNLAYDRQLVEKDNTLKKLLDEYHFGSQYHDEAIANGITPEDIENKVVVERIRASSSPFNYRTRSEFTCALKNGPHIGLYKKRSFDVLDIQTCHVLTSDSQSAYDAVAVVFKELVERRVIVPYNPRSGSGTLKHVTIRTTTNAHGETETLVTLVSPNIKTVSSLVIEKFLNALRERVPSLRGLVLSEGKYNIQHPEAGAGGVRTPAATEKGTELCVWGRPFIEQRLMGADLRLGPRTFAFANHHLWSQFAEEVVAMAEVKSTDVIWDLFCGSGTWSTILGRKAKEVVSIDCRMEALDELEDNLFTHDLASKSHVVHANLHSWATLLNLSEHVQRWVAKTLQSGANLPINAVTSPSSSSSDVKLFDSISEERLAIEKMYDLLARRKASYITHSNIRGTSFESQPFKNVPAAVFNKKDEKETELQLMEKAKQALALIEKDEREKAMATRREKRELERLRREAEEVDHAMDASKLFTSVDEKDVGDDSREPSEMDGLDDGEDLSSFNNDEERYSNSLRWSRRRPKDGEQGNGENFDVFKGEQSKRFKSAKSRDESKSLLNFRDFAPYDISTSHARHMDPSKRMLPPPDIMIIEPDRIGTHKSFRRWLRTTVAPKVIYIGHDSYTLLRDLRNLKAAGYVLKKVVPFDSNPHTPQIVVACLLTLPAYEEALTSIKQAAEQQELAKAVAKGYWKEKTQTPSLSPSRSQVDAVSMSQQQFSLAAGATVEEQLSSVLSGVSESFSWQELFSSFKVADDQMAMVRANRLESEHLAVDAALSDAPEHSRREKIIEQGLNQQDSLHDVLKSWANDNRIEKNQEDKEGLSIPGEVAMRPLGVSDSSQALKNSSQEPKRKLTGLAALIAEVSEGDSLQSSHAHDSTPRDRRKAEKEWETLEKGAILDAYGSGALQGVRGRHAKAAPKFQEDNERFFELRRLRATGMEYGVTPDLEVRKMLKAIQPNMKARGGYDVKRPSVLLKEIDARLKSQGVDLNALDREYEAERKLVKGEVKNGTRVRSRCESIRK